MVAGYSSSAGAEAPLIISPSQLHRSLKDKKKVTILDTTWFMPNAPRKAREEFQKRRIPGAQFLDLDELASSHELGLKHMMPSGPQFSAACEEYGIEPSTHVVLYDNHGIFSSPRALFMFRSLGHLNSSVLNGGLPHWDAQSFTVDNSPPTPPSQKSRYTLPEPDRNAVRNYEQMVANSALDPSTSVEAELVLDARSAGRFSGNDPEPRPGLSSGHIPNSFSLPFTSFLKTETGPQGSTYTIFREPSDIRQELIAAVGASHAERIINGESTAVTTCGSGMTAGVVWLGLKLLNVPKLSLYDESWTGYAMRPASRIEKA
ncbi:Rhodanese-like domain-containing protein [Lentinula raphanica]|uniref:Rhodanese-like domain-containing protein n=1 Tax=Lentinula raphanica TaxID=153919 RepID=A0AA38PHD2_9AGAR|nr:Rhodanese-like domain-containing protein [Lentinula raphanica]KAJ3828497.1 Rhodanese-like domain-containing protein [Lentinula raphanica]KAJ3842975.1 Rhodanese-like domain-containing protein [Lentinula raphanica]KAJ3974401.1 Rhodanese-like domain-containing protein [Lentinula raphanica]